jgi:divalent metal cation (Fe/Co/Zn/Cd) transporter
VAPRLSLTRARSVLRAEVASIRRHDPDVDPGEIAGFTLPLLLRVAGVGAIGVVPLLVVRNGSDENAELVPILGSLALVLICAAVVSWLLSVVISGLVVMVLYQTRPAASSKLVTRILTESFMRVDDIVSALMLLALLAGLVSLAFGLPIRSGDEQANPVIDDLLTAQVGVFIVALGIMFISESIRSAADIVDDQSLLLAWPWALLIGCAVGC